MKCRRAWRVTAALAGLAVFATLPPGVAAQAPGSFAKSEAILAREHPETHALLLRLEHARGVLFDELAVEGRAVRAIPNSLRSPNFEFDMLERLSVLAGEGGTRDDNDAGGAKAGQLALGERTATVIAWTNEFRRGVLGILADPNLTEVPARRAALAEAISQYQSRPDAALPSRPKNMDVLYFHDQALNFRTTYTDLGGLIWAGHWFALASAKPLLDLTDAERAAGLDTVRARYYSKLSYGEPPEFFPSELPLAPAIAPELSFLSPETVAIWDNLSMLEEVLADILVSLDLADERAAIDNAVDFFLDPELGVTDPLEFGAMALRHGIFFQGGYPLAEMTKSERNADGHAAHLRSGRVTLPGM